MGSLKRWGNIPRENMRTNQDLIVLPASAIRWLVAVCAGNMNTNYIYYVGDIINMKNTENINAIFEDITTPAGTKGVHFVLTAKSGWCSGMYVPKEKKIFVHAITAINGLRVLMDTLVLKFGANKIQFTPLITSMLENKIRNGVKSVIPAKAKENPYGEDIEVLDCVWETKRKCEK